VLKYSAFEPTAVSWLPVVLCERPRACSHVVTAHSVVLERVLASGPIERGKAQCAALSVSLLGRNHTPVGIIGGGAIGAGIGGS
jgi:hypothetical protein